MCCGKARCGLLWAHFRECAVEELGVGYSGPTFVNVLWKSWCELLWAHFRECAVEELGVGYSGPTLVDVLWKG